MFSGHVFPNFSVPPPVLPPIISLTEDIDTKVEFFLKSHVFEPQQEPSIKLRLLDLNQRLDNLTQAKNDLESLFQELQSNVKQLSEEEWQYKVSESERLQTKIDLETTFLHQNTAKIQRLIKKRQNKRKSRAKRKVFHNQHLADRQKKHQEIDRNLKEIQMKSHADKQTRAEKEETQTTLACVHKRIREAKERLELFESLLKLRQIRKQQSQSSERDVTEESFVEEISRMKTLWNMALEQHLDEERKLREYLDNKFRPQQTIEQQWNEVLFGQLTMKKIDHPLLRAEKSLKDFMTIRHEWDACVDPTGSPIPFFWVMPNKSGTEWQQYQQ